jgi:hypothetical protein
LGRQESQRKAREGAEGRGSKLAWSFEQQFVAAKDTTTQEAIYGHVGFNIGRGSRPSGERIDKRNKKISEGPQDKGEPKKTQRQDTFTPQQGKEGGNSVSLIADAVKGNYTDGKTTDRQEEKRVRRVGQGPKRHLKKCGEDM